MMVVLQSCFTPGGSSRRFENRGVARGAGYYLLNGIKGVLFCLGQE